MKNIKTNTKKRPKTKPRAYARMGVYEAANHLEDKLHRMRRKLS